MELNKDEKIMLNEFGIKFCYLNDSIKLATECVFTRFCSANDLRIKSLLKMIEGYSADLYHIYQQIKTDLQVDS